MRDRVSVGEAGTGELRGDGAEPCVKATGLRGPDESEAPPGETGDCGGRNGVSYLSGLQQITCKFFDSICSDSSHELGLVGVSVDSELS